MFSSSLRKFLANGNLRCDPAGLVQITKTPESRKSEKITKKMQNPLPGLGPENTKKLPKKYKMAKNHIFVFLGSSFRIFGAQSGEGGFCIFFRNYFVFSGFRGFCDLYQARRVAKFATRFASDCERDGWLHSGRLCKDNPWPSIGGFYTHAL